MARYVIFNMNNPKLLLFENEFFGTKAEIVILIIVIVKEFVGLLLLLFENALG